MKRFLISVIAFALSGGAALAQLNNSSPPLTVTDGMHTVAGTTSLTVTGGTIGGASPNATLTVSGGLPSGGSVGQAVVNTGSGTGTWGSVILGAAGGPALLQAGAGANTGVSGGTDAGSGGGSALISGSASLTTGQLGGSAFLSGGAATVGTANGGNVTIQPGAGIGGGSAGHLRLLNVPLVDPASANALWINTLGFVNDSGNATPFVSTGTPHIAAGITYVDFTASFGAVTALTGSAKTQAITGLLTTDQVHVECISAPPSGYIPPNARVSAADTLELFFNTSVAVGITLGSLTFRVTVIR
jgi:hypothetical protein